ncbi:hypothetical protein Cgig2_021613 [Carnegiea gigantea]|uniref:DUF4283 domain-containing protein n=1 Tax=Carnegiea gigantea TaxID=171969 RepID=A0A9Q1JKZ2_9CARY|nr:hypothetical protein Cgig2_021613 [Carnegiea gigantea]
MVDPNEDTSLEFILATAIHGTKCAKLMAEDVKDEIEYWQNALICSILRANPPFEVMKGFLKRIWSNYELNKVLQVHKGIFLVRFANLPDKIQVENRGIYFFDSKPVLAKGWNPNMDIQKEAIKSPIWVQFPDLNIKYWGISSLSKISSVLGIPIKTDNYTREKTWLSYARVLIKMPIEGPFPEHIEFINEHDMLVRQVVKYEWLPIKCHHCGMLGHEEQDEVGTTTTPVTLKVEYGLHGGLKLIPLILYKLIRKFHWIRHGDDNTRLFFAKAKQRKLATYIFSIKDDKGDAAEGFENIGKVMLSYYQNLLGIQHTNRSPVEMSIINQGPVLSIENKSSYASLLLQ